MGRYHGRQGSQMHPGFFRRKRRFPKLKQIKQLQYRKPQTKRIASISLIDQGYIAGFSGWLVSPESVSVDDGDAPSLNQAKATVDRPAQLIVYLAYHLSFEISMGYMCKSLCYEVEGIPRRDRTMIGL